MSHFVGNPEDRVCPVKAQIEYSKCDKILNTFLFPVIRVGIHKMLVRIANREDPDQTAVWGLESDLCMQCFWIQ